MHSQGSIHDLFECKVIGCGRSFIKVQEVASHYEVYHKGIPFPSVYKDKLDDYLLNRK